LRLRSACTFILLCAVVPIANDVFVATKPHLCPVQGNK
ncbi:hypothetical protein A2U01_0085319, partial [Trifolium medium]|nr:hypothetical protein [Trifolium medium]